MSWKVLLLSVAAAVEGATGFALIVVPHLVSRLLFAADLVAAGTAIARVAGIALLSFSLGCWLDRRRADAETSALVPMLAYNILVTPFLIYLGMGSELIGILLWPAVAIHAVFTLLFAYALASGNQDRAWSNG